MTRSTFDTTRAAHAPTPLDRLSKVASDTPGRLFYWPAERHCAGPAAALTRRFQPRSTVLQVALVRLIRTWIDIISEQPAIVRGLLLIVFLASLSLYLLGIASVVAASRIAAVATTTPVTVRVEQTVLVIATEVAAEETPEPTATATVVVPVQQLLRATSTPAGSVTATPTLEPTPTQARNVPRIVAPPEPSVAPAKPQIQLSPVTTPGTGTPTTRTPAAGSPTVVGTGTRTGSPVPGAPPLLVPVGTQPAGGLRPSVGTPGEAEPNAPSATPTVRLGAPVVVGSPVPAGSPPAGAPPAIAPTAAAPTPAPPAVQSPQPASPATPQAPAKPVLNAPTATPSR
jgi:hypothetical protein